MNNFVLWFANEINPIDNDDTVVTILIVSFLHACVNVLHLPVCLLWNWVHSKWN
jgi:hypothetical protein